MIRTGLSLLRPTLQSTRAALVLSVVAGVVRAGCGGGGGDASGTASVCDPDDGGLTLPDGFCATVVADSLGQPRHLAVADNGDVYAALRETNSGGGAVALRDTDGDHHLADCLRRRGGQIAIGNDRSTPQGPLARTSAFC